MECRSTARVRGRHSRAVAAFVPLWMTMLGSALAGDPGGTPEPAQSSQYPVWDTRIQYVGQVWLTMTSYGLLGAGRAPSISLHNSILDPKRDRRTLGISWIPSFEFPPGTQNDYLNSAGLAFGCIRGYDTLVSVGGPIVSHGFLSVEFLSFRPIRELSSSRQSPFYDPRALSEQEYSAVYSDTSMFNRYPDEVDLRLTAPIGLEVHQTSRAWPDGFSRSFIIVDYWIKNIGIEPISEGVVGLVVRPAVFSDRNPGAYAAGDVGNGNICGLLSVVPGIVPNTPDTVNIVWAADNDGDPSNGSFVPYSVTGALGIRILRAPPGMFSFNWWTLYAGKDELFFWGPRRIENSFGYRGQPGDPSGDRNRYKMMTNGEIDYDQVYAAHDYSMDGWARPLSRTDLAVDIANGAEPEFLLSVGPFPDIPPGDSVEFTIALIAGHDVHTDPQNFALNFDPGDPKPYLDRLNFSDLITNARWADWVFDNPGVDTDHDGNRGRAYLADCDGIDTVGYDTTITGNPPETTIVPITAATGCDSVFYKGDGVPDWRGPQAPPAPEFKLSSQPGRVTLRWSGAFTETQKDPLSRKRDFEGYKVYVGRFSTNDQFSLIASWDKEDYSRFAYDPDVETLDVNPWKQISNPQSIEQWRRELNDPQFDPRQYATPNLDQAYRDTVVDTTRNLQGEILRIERRERFSYWAPQDYNRTNRYWETDRWEDNLIQQVEVRDTTIDYERLSYGVYEITIDNLQYSVPLYFAVTAFDFGDFAMHLDPLESAPANNNQYGHPIYSADVVIDSSLKVGVYPNPYKISYEDAFGRTTTYYAEGYEGRGRPEFTEHDRRIHFINLPDTATIRIYSLDGDLIRTIHHPDKFLTTYSSSVGWDLISRNAQAVVSGIYIYRVDSRLGTQIGKLVIIK